MTMRTFLRQFSAVALSLAAAIATTPARSQYTSDIDIYSGAPSELDLPNVLVVIDNTANWNQVFEVEKKALKDTFTSLPVNRFRTGLMMFTQSSDSVEGAFVMSGIRTLDATYQPRLGSLIDSFINEPSNKKGHKGNNATAGLAMAEAYHYFAGKAPYAGAGAVKADYASNTSGNAAENAVYALPGNALPSRGAARYDNTFALENCAANYVIYISNGPANDNASSTAKADELLTKAYAELGEDKPGTIVVSPNGQQSNVADEWARFMKTSPRRITTYTIDVVDKSSTKGQGPNWTALLKSMSAVSGGEYFAIDTSSEADVGAKIQEALADIFNQIQAVNSVFASASLPVSVNARGTYLNQVFMGMFRPDGDGKPRWRGNLKQYSFGYDPATDSLNLVDATGEPAISGATGFLSPSATSYWSHSSTYWVTEPMGTPATASDAPDGEVVEKGGIAQGIRETHAASQDERRILTCVGCAPATNLATSTATQFTRTNITPALLGVSGDAERNEIVDWFRGADNTDTEAGPGDGVTIRPSVHGDVLHSRPAVVNYGGSTGVVVFYGANDGLLRAVNGNQSGTGAGQELWGFIPEEHLRRIKRLRDNTPSIRLSTTMMPSTSGPADPLPRDYFVDGPIGVYQKVNASGTSEKVLLFTAMRRGGRLLYALDVTNPAEPKFAWKHNPDTLPVLGQTWSEPKVARLRGHANPVLVMGAGYDPAAEDVSPPGTTTMGKAVVVLDAFDGRLLKQFATDRSVAADVSLVDADYDGLVDRAYAVDLGGNLYRIDFETEDSADVTKWDMYKLAALNGGSGTVPRKFFYAPDVVLTRNFAAVMLASGDREKPLARTSNDGFFTIYDRHVTKGKPESFTAVVPGELAAVGSGDSMEKGCFIELATDGEKAVNAPVTAAGVTYFSTNKPKPPSTDTCSSNLGEAKVYSAPLFCKAATSQVLTGGGLPPSPVVGVVTVTYTSHETGETASKEVPFIIGAPNAKNSGIEGSKVKPLITPTRKKKYWYLENAR